MGGQVVSLHGSYSECLILHYISNRSFDKLRFFTNLEKGRKRLCILHRIDLSIESKRVDQ